MCPALSFFLYTQVDAAVIECDVINDKWVLHAAVSDGSKSLLKADLIISALIDGFGKLSGATLVSPIHVRSNSATAAAVQPDVISDVSRQFIVFIIIALYSKSIRWQN